MVLSGGDWKALYEAAKQGDLDDVRQWLSRGVDPNYQHPEFGTTPLIIAAEFGQLDAVKALVENGADPAITSLWDGWTAEQAAAQNRHKHVVAWLQGQKA